MINKKGYVYNLFRLLWRIFKEMPVMSFLVFVIPLLSGMLSVFIYSAQARIIDIVAYHISSKEWIIIFMSIWKPLSVIVGISMLQAVSSLLEKVFGYKLRERISLIFKNQIIDITNSIQYTNYDDEEFCNKLQRAKAVAGDDLVNILFNITGVINIAASLLSIVLLANSTGLYSISFVVIIMIVLNLTIKMSTELKVKKLNRDLTSEGRMGDYLSDTLTKSNAIREMRIYNSTGYFLNLWGNTIKKQHNKRMNARRTEIKVGFIAGSIQSVVIFIVLAELIKHISVSNKITIGLIATLFLNLIQSYGKIMALTWPLSKLYISCSRLYDFHEFMSIKKEGTSNYDNRKYSDDGNRNNADMSPVVLSNVGFAYKNSKGRILSDINLTINKNEKIAVVGANGAGKSTLIKLILGLYSPNSGSITWNGSEKLASKIAVVFQNYIKFQLTLRENIAMGNIEQMNNDELIMETMKKCNCYDLYEELGSLDVPLGRMVSGGRELSGGQWQRLAICRAIFSDSDLLIFDEPTASVDPKTEVEIFNNIMNICKDKTAIFISHRLGWAKNADRIIVINNGQIKENGTHDELISSGGIYSNMYSMQASWYAE